MAEPGRCLVVVGGTGGLGRRLVPALVQQGYRLRLLVRSLSKAVRLFPAGVEHYVWDSRRELPERVLDGAWGVLNFAGAPIARRWTPKYRQIILESRVATTQRLVHALLSAQHSVQVFLSVSAIGYYGDCGEKECDEDTPAGMDFLASVCQRWEEAALMAAE
ncbi:MAG: NAD-dependent epimerase/dehydratase family protein, partial [Candidatus Kapabacteria bacterium]|nr:NAD-dependent epimerase/dehydratase family protein [Candidatus Kapabacteria bacterium]MDW7996166.1 NAD-dependent epimerase/dehydratase family protein [Bacteroidota bacterium]